MSEREKRAAEADLEGAPAAKHRDIGRKHNSCMQGNSVPVYHGSIIRRPTMPIASCADLLWHCAFNALMIHCGREDLTVPVVFAKIYDTEGMEVSFSMPVKLPRGRGRVICARISPDLCPFTPSRIGWTQVSIGRGFRTFVVDSTLQDLFSAAEVEFYRSVHLYPLAQVFGTVARDGVEDAFLRARALADLLPTDPSRAEIVEKMAAKMAKAFTGRRPFFDNGWGDWGNRHFILFDAVVTMADGEQLCFPQVSYGNLGTLFGGSLSEVDDDESNDINIYVVDGDTTHAVPLVSDEKQ